MNSPEQYEAAYHQILTHVEQENGLGRRYKRFHDKPIYYREFDHKEEQAPTMFVERSLEEGSWQSYIETCFKTKRLVIDDVIRNFSNYRESEHQRVTERQMTECIKNMEMLNPISLKTMLDTLIPNLQRLQAEAKRRIGRGD